MRLRSHVAGVLGVISLTSLGRAQLSAPQAAHAWRIAHEQTILREFTDLIALPTSRATRRIFIATRTLSWPLWSGGKSPQRFSKCRSKPVVFGNITTPGARRTIVFYATTTGSRLRRRLGQQNAFAR